MKKIVSFVLLAAVIFVFVGCSGGMSPVEEALLAVRKVDIAALEKLLTPETRAVTDSMREYDKMLDTERQDVLLSLYALLEYTMGEESALDNGVKTVSVTVRAPDMARIRALAEKRVLASGEAVYEAVDAMLRDGSVAKSYMVERTLAVRLEQRDGAWRIPYSEAANGAPLEMLSLSEMLRFFAQN